MNAAEVVTISDNAKAILALLEKAKEVELTMLETNERIQELEHRYQVLVEKRNSLWEAARRLHHS
jgi:hypothetical protein